MVASVVRADEAQSLGGVGGFGVSGSGCRRCASCGYCGRSITEGETRGHLVTGGTTTRWVVAAGIASGTRTGTEQQFTGHNPSQTEQERTDHREQRERQLLWERWRHSRTGLGDEARFNRHILGCDNRAVVLHLLLKALKFAALALGGGFKRAQFGIVARGVDDVGLQFTDLLVDGVNAQASRTGFFFETLRELGDFRGELTAQAAEIGIQLLHARMAGQQGRRQLGNLPFEADALAFEALDQR
jgi:hypothetical protein